MRQFVERDVVIAPPLVIAPVLRVLHRPEIDLRAAGEGPRMRRRRKFRPRDRPRVQVAAPVLQFRKLRVGLAEQDAPVMRDVHLPQRLGQQRVALAAARRPAVQHLIFPPRLKDPLLLLRLPQNAPRALLALPPRGALFRHAFSLPPGPAGQFVCSRHVCARGCSQEGVYRAFLPKNPSLLARKPSCANPRPISGGRLAVHAQGCLRPCAAALPPGSDALPTHPASNPCRLPAISLPVPKALPAACSFMQAHSALGTTCLPRPPVRGFAQNFPAKTHCSA